MNLLEKLEILKRIEKLAILSRHFTFLVGKRRIPITIHVDIVTGLSAPLDALINNGVMGESTAGVAILDDVEAWVFQKFCQFAYTGSYSVKKPNDRPVVSIETETPNDNTPASLTATKASSSSNVPERPSAPKLQQPDVTMVDNADMSPELRRLVGRLRNQFSLMRPTIPPRDHQRTVINRTHVDVYVFATKYLIEPLRQRCLDYLHYELNNALQRAGLPVQVQLLEYIYGNTTPYEPGGASAMRHLIIRYAACYISSLKSLSTFEELVKRRPEIAVDLLNVLVE